MPDQNVPAPAQVDTPAPVLSATQQAAADNDFATFESSRFATASGKSAPAPTPAKVETPAEKPITAAPVQPATEEPAKVSKRQQDTNDRIRIATEKAVAERDAEIARLRAQLNPPRPSAPAQPDAPLTLAQTIAQPNIRQAPITETQFFELHPDAGIGDYARYAASWQYAYSRATEQQETEQQAAQRAEGERRSKAKASMDAAVTADPNFVAKVEPVLTSLRTREQAAAAGLQPGPEHDFASALVRSEVAGKLLNHLADHPDVLDKVKALETRSDVLTFFGRLEARFLDSDTPPAIVPAAPKPKTVSDAPPPPPTLGARPATTAEPLKGAVERDDYKGYEAARFAGHQPGR